MMFLSFLRGQKNTHSFLPKCKDNLLSTSQFEHDSITSDIFFVILPLGHYGQIVWHCHLHKELSYSQH